MAKYDDFKTKALDALNSLADASAEAYKTAEEKTRILARKTKLRAGIVNDKATIRRLSVELGTKYYNKYKDDEASEFGQLCNEITGAYDKIAAKEAEIAELKVNTCTKNNDTPACTSNPECTPECCPDSEPTPIPIVAPQTEIESEEVVEINLFDQNNNPEG